MNIEISLILIHAMILNGNDSGSAVGARELDLPTVILYLYWFLNRKKLFREKEPKKSNK